MNFSQGGALMDITSFTSSKGPVQSIENSHNANHLGASLRRDAQARRLATVPKNSAPLFTREQKQFLAESLILIGSGLALLFFLLNPGSSRANTLADTAIAERVRFTHEARMEEEERRNRTVEIIGTLSCENSATTQEGSRTAGCQTVVLKESGTGKNFILNNAGGALDQFNGGNKKVRVTGTAMNLIDGQNRKNRQLAQQSQEQTNRNSIDVNTITSIE